MTQRDKDMTAQVKGAKGKGGHTPVEDPNSLRSNSTGRLIDLISEGPIVGIVGGKKGIYFDRTPLKNDDDSTNFEGVTVHTRKGDPTQDHIPGFDATESEVAFNVEVQKITDVVRTINEAAASAVRVKLQVPQLVHYQDNGDVKGTEVVLGVYMKTNTGDYVLQQTVTIDGKTTSPYERSIRVELPEGGAPWNIKVVRETDDSTDSKLVNKTFWAGYTLLTDAKLSYPDTALVGLEIDAKSFGSRIPERIYRVKGMIIDVPSNYDPDARTYSGLWDGTFKKAWTNNPAWVLYALMTNPRYGLGDLIPATTIDKWGLYSIAQYCDGPVRDGKGGYEPRFTFNGTIRNRQESIKLLDSISSVFRGMLYWGAGSVMLSQDSPATPAKLVSPANVIGGEFTYQGTPLTSRSSSVAVSWNDPDDLGKVSVLIVQNDELIRKFGDRRRDVAAMGCTSRGQAKRVAEWILYTEERESEVVTYLASLDHADVRPGQIISIADPSYAGARFGGRLKSSTTDGVFTLDAPIKMEAGSTYSISVTLPDGVIKNYTLTNTETETDTVTTTDDVGDAANLPLVGSMWVITATEANPRKFRVLSNTERAPNKYEINAVLHFDQKYDYVERSIDFDTPSYSVVDASAISPPQSVDVTMQRRHRKGSESQFVALASWPRSASANIRAYGVWIKEPDVAERYFGEVADTSVEIPSTHNTAGEYTVTVRSLSYEGNESRAVSGSASTSTVSVSLATPTGWSAEGAFDQVILTGDQSTVDDFSHFNIYGYTDSGNTATKLGTATSPYYARRPAEGDEFTRYTITQEDYSGNESGHTAHLSASPITEITDSAPSVPSNLALTSALDGTEAAEVTAQWSSVSSAVSYVLGVKVNGGGEVEFTTTSTQYKLTVLPGQSVSARVRAVDSFSRLSDWSATVEHTAIRDDVPPAVPTGLTITEGFETLWLECDKNTEADFDNYDIHIADTNTAPVNQGGTVTYVTAANSFVLTGLGDGVEKFFWVRAVDTSGNQSDWSAGVSGTTTKIDLSNLGTSVTDEIEDAAQSALADKNEAVAASAASQGARDQSIAAKDLAESAKDTAVLNASNAGTSAALAANAQHATVLVEGNPSFESKYEGWLSSYLSASTALTASHGLIGAHTGRASVFESLDGVVTWPCQERIWTLEAGRKYRARGSLRAVGGNAVLYAGLACVDASEAPVGSNDGLYYNMISGATYAASAGWIDVVSPVFDIDTLRAAKGSAVTGVRLVSVLNYTNIAGSKGAVDGLWLEDVTESEAANAFASAAATSASVVTVMADEVSQDAASATTASNEAETARAASEVFRDQSAASATDAENSSATAESHKNLAAQSQAVVEEIVKSTERFDFNNGADYWVNGYTMAKSALPTAPDVTVNSAVTLVDVSGEGKVIQSDGLYAIMTERVTRAFVTGQKFRGTIRTRLTTDPAAASGDHVQYVWLVGVNGDAQSGYMGLKTWVGLTVADGWVERTFEFDPGAIRAANAAYDFGDATEWRLMVGLNGYDADVGGAVQQISYARLDEITSEKAAEGHATAAANEKALAATKADEAGQSAAASQEHSTEAGAHAATATTKADQASTSEANADGFAQAAAASANEVQARLDQAIGLAGNWNFADGLEGWAVSGGAGLATKSEAYTAGQAVYCVGYSVLEWDTPIPVDRERTYKVKIRARRYQGTASTNGHLYCGLATYDKDGNIETASPGSHRYGVCIAIDLPESGGWVEYEGLFTDGGNDNHNQFRTTTASAAPIVLANYNGTADDKTVIDYVTFEDVTGLVAEASIRQSAIAEIDGKLASSITMRAKAGTSGAVLELAAADDPSGAQSSARISADDIILDGSVSADQIAANEVITYAANIKDAVITDAKIADLSAAKLTAGTALAGSITVEGRALSSVAGGTVLFDKMDDLWSAMQGAGNQSQSSGFAKTGSLSIVANSGTATWLLSPDKIDFDPEALYKITFTVRRYSGTGTGYMYLGINAYAADGVTHVGVTGVNTWGAQHYVVQSSRAQNTVTSGSEYETFVGYVKGTASQGTQGPTSLAAPGKLHHDTRKIGLMALFNYGGGDAVMLMDTAKIEVVSEEDAAAMVNAGSTKIDPGQVTISGGTTVADWRMGGDETNINGGRVSANTIATNALTVGNRAISTYGLKFSTSGNTVSWGSGIVFYTANDNTKTYVNVTSGAASYTGSVVYIYWAYASGVLSSTTDRSVAQADDVFLVGTYAGGTNAVMDVGRTVIVGDYIATGTIKAVHADFESMSALGLTAGNADIENLSVDTLKIANQSVSITRLASGTGNQSLTWTPGHNSDISVMMFTRVTVTGSTVNTGYARIYNGGTLLKQAGLTNPDTSPDTTTEHTFVTPVAKTSGVAGTAITISATLAGGAATTEEVTMLVIEAFK